MFIYGSLIVSMETWAKHLFSISTEEDLFPYHIKFSVC